MEDDQIIIFVYSGSMNGKVVPFIGKDTVSPFKKSSVHRMISVFIQTSFIPAFICCLPISEMILDSKQRSNILVTCMNKVSKQPIKINGIERKDANGECGIPKVIQKIYFD